MQNKIWFITGSSRKNYGPLKIAEAVVKIAKMKNPPVHQIIKEML